MQVKSIDSQYSSPNFGIKYIKPRSWNPSILDALMKSDLVKQIDRKYPNASVTYDYFFGHITKRGFYTLDFNLNNIIKPQILETKFFKLIDEIRTINLKDLEKNFIDKVERRKTREQQVENIYKAAEEANAGLIEKKHEKRNTKKFTNGPAKQCAIDIEDKKTQELLVEMTNLLDGIVRHRYNIPNYSKDFLKMGKHINDRITGDGYSAIHLLAASTRADLMELLLKHPDIDIKVRTDWGDTALQIASRVGYYDDRTMKLLGL